MNNELKLLELFKDANIKFSNKAICKFSEEQESKYNILLQCFKDVNENKNASNREKGKALEELVSFLLFMSGDIFEVFQNVKTNTNEVDQIVRLSPKGKLLLANGLLNDQFKNFICECKNYNKSVDVTYVGKLYSLMHSCDVKLSVLFSYKGVSGKKWNYASGLIRKIYMSTNQNGEHETIIDFNKNDFESIAKGDNFLDIIENKITSLKYDTDFSSQITTHPAEGKFSVT